MAGLLALSRGIDAMNTAIGRIAAWAIVVAIVVSTLNAISRKLFGISSNAWLELQWYLFGATFMLCAPWTLAVNEHIRIDLVSSRLSVMGRNIVEMMGHLLFLLPFVLVMTYLSWPFFLSSFNSGEVSSSAGGLTIWPAKAVILVGFALLLVQWLSEVIKRAAVMTGAIEDPHGPGHHPQAEIEAEPPLVPPEVDRPVPVGAPVRVDRT